LWLWGIIHGVTMQLDGPLEPNTIVIGLPIVLKEKFRLQFMQVGMTSAEATIESLNFIKQTVEKYVPAGSPYIIIDENDNVWDGIPIGQS